VSVLQHQQFNLNPLFYCQGDLTRAHRQAYFGADFVRGVIVPSPY